LKKFPKEIESVPKINLVTGDVKGRVWKSDVPLANWIFAVALHEVCLAMKRGDESMFAVRVSMVNEPGKSRSVTMGKACLNLILDVVNSICSAPLKKLKDHKSGMTKGSSSWNFYNRLFSKEAIDVLFNAEAERFASTPKKKPGLHQTVYYQDVCALSIDFENATDYMNHRVARVHASNWLDLCGIPRVLSGIVLKSCSTPRQVHFKATGILKNLGKPVPGAPPGSNLRYILNMKGIFMGDPFTKIVLHLVHEIGTCVTLSNHRDWQSVFGPQRGKQFYALFARTRDGTNKSPMGHRSKTVSVHSRERLHDSWSNSVQ
jgi:hypothetical protein